MSDALHLTSTRRADTIAVGRAIGALAVAGDVIALDGPLGAGKTQLVRGVAEGMGLNPNDVSSPTFVFVQEYLAGPAADAGAAVLVHVDAYRLDSADQLESIGWCAELLEGAVLAVEWAPRIAEALPADALHIGVTHVDDTTRHLTIEPCGTWQPRFAALRAMVSAYE